MNPKPLVKFTPKRLPERNRMTYIAAFMAKPEGSLVMCADTLETVGDDARYVEKLVHRQCGKFNLVMGGAGAGDYVDGFIDRLAHDIDVSGVDDFSALRNQAQKSLRDFYREEVPLSTLPAKYRNMECLIAAQKTGSTVRLWKTRQSHLFDVHEFDIVGYNTPVNFHLARGLYRDSLPLYQVMFVAAYLVAVAKATASGVSGETRIAVLTPSGVQFEHALDIRAFEDRVNEFQAVINRLFLDSMDLSLHARSFDERLEEYRKEFVKLRKKHRRYVAERIARRLREPDHKNYVYPDVPFGTAVTVTTDDDGNLIYFKFKDDPDTEDLSS